MNEFPRYPQSKLFELVLWGVLLTFDRKTFNRKRNDRSCRVRHKTPGYLNRLPVPPVTAPHEHCWHDTGVVLTSMPPQYPQFCCRCEERQVRRGADHPVFHFHND